MLSKILNLAHGSVKHVWYFDELTKDDVSLAGEKGANLCELFRIGNEIL